MKLTALLLALGVEDQGDGLLNLTGAGVVYLWYREGGTLDVPFSLVMMVELDAAEEDQEQALVIEAIDPDGEVVFAGDMTFRYLTNSGRARSVHALHHDFRAVGWSPGAYAIHVYGPGREHLGSCPLYVEERTGR